MCDIIVHNTIRPATDCKCYKAVMQAYGCMMEAGEPQSIALEAAMRVYGYHHPEDAKAIQTLTVERWVNERSLH